ncbi:MAG: ABC transporter ATP-binding protein [Verrucomicrobiae bacterium]|nr:ABC transporter ATP-binding protein [Verrucomicrobiae bacterium]
MAAEIPQKTDLPFDSEAGEESRAATPWQALKLYLDLAKGHRVTLWVAVAHLAVGILGHLVFVVAAGWLVDSTLSTLGMEIPLKDGGEPLGIDKVGGFLFLTMLVTLYCTYVDMGSFIELGERAAARLRDRLFGRLIHLPMTFFESTRIGDLSSRLLADVALLQETWTNDLRTYTKNVLMLVGAVVLLFVLSHKLGGLVLITVLPIVAVSVWSGSRIRRESSSVQERLSRTSVIIDEVLTAIRSVKTFSNEAHEAGRFHTAIDDFLRPAVKVARHRAGYVCLILLVLFSCIILLMWYGSREIAARHLTVGDFTAFMSALVLAATAGGLLAELMGRFQRMGGATSRVLALLEEPMEQLDGGTITPEPGDRLEGRVAFRGVRFRYPSRPGAVVLENFELEIAPGERVALVGPSGAGKSTVTALLFRLHDPESGELLIDDRPARDYPLGWLRNQMAMVPQEVLLFGGSVAENIAYGRPGASREEIEAAARQANAFDFIQQLPEGFETLVGDRGVQLSGGQRQRVAIARAILKDPAILVLDEATSSLDSENERLVREALDGLTQSRTTLVIAHRLRTVREADRIVVLREGNIAEVGTHEALYTAGGHYRMLCDAEGEGSGEGLG